MKQETTSSHTSIVNVKEYTAKDIHVLEGLEAVRRRPGMYIGSTDRNGLHHLVYEIVNNSIDEAMAGHCNRISVTLLKGGIVRVEDNGRGIPVDIHPVTGKSALETIMTTLHAGAKFGGHTYQVSGGLHGVGAAVVNALSAWLKISVKRDGRIYEQEYRKGVPQTELIEIRDNFNTGETGTAVAFLADETIFGEIGYENDTLCKWLREMAYLNKSLEISFRDETLDYEKVFYFEGGITSLLRNLNKGRAVNSYPPIYFSKKEKGTEVEIALQYCDGYAESVLSFANCVNTVDGGAHLTGFRSALTRVINDYARTRQLLKDEDPNLTGEDVREGLTAIISVKLMDPQFEGQTKTRLGNAGIKGIVDNITADELSLFLEEHPDYARGITTKCILAAKAREAARKARDLVVKKSNLFAGALPGKLADCSEKEPSNCELYLVEGDSAGGSAKQCRDRHTQAILPLRGKIINVEKATQEKMFSHQEIRDIITALGAGVDSELDLSRLRYHRVIIMTDADVDGAHIRTLLLTFFFRHMSRLIDDGHLYIAQPPLYRVKFSRSEQWLYSEAEKEELLNEIGRTKKVDVQRYKGLGEMTAEQLWQTTMNPATRTLLRVCVEDAAQADNIIHALMGAEVPPRKAFIQAHARKVINLDV